MAPTITVGALRDLIADVPADTPVLGLFAGDKRVDARDIEIRLGPDVGSPDPADPDTLIIEFPNSS